jgi:hypothetical protein
MSRSNFILPIVAFVGLTLFFLALGRILLLRYERGDIYPAYSTLRADPLGARAYFESLDSIKGYSPRRGFNFLHQELEEHPATMFYLGFDAEELSSFTKEEVAQLDAYVRQGGRVVLTLSPEESDTVTMTSEQRKKKAEKDARKSTPDKKDSDAPTDKAEELSDGPQTAQEKYEREELQKEKEDYEKYVEPNPPPSSFHYHRSLAALWGFGWDNHHDAVQKKITSRAATDADTHTEEDPELKKPDVFAFYGGEEHLESQVPWKSALYFVRLESDWQPLYYAKTQPVLIRRSWGKGEIIVATDSYFLSNEALRNSRTPLLLTYLAGPANVLVFDETHLGTQQQEGVMFLMNRFRLEGYLYGALAVMLLFLWRNSCPLVPPQVRSHRVLGGTVSGMDSRSGLVNLLRRNIGMSEILSASFAEWKRSVIPSQNHLKEKMEAMSEVLASSNPKKSDQIVQTYHRLREINTSLNRDTYATKP